MKYFKMLGLATAAAIALMAFAASSASATTLNNGSTVLKKGSSIDASLTGSEPAKLEAGSTVLDECSGGTVEGVTTNETGATVNGTVATKDLTWSGCTKTTNTLNGGSLSISYSSGDNGSVTATGFEVTVNTIFGSCVYGWANTFKNIGTLVGGTQATIAVNTTVKKLSGPLACPGEPTWTANYTVTNPFTLNVMN